MRVLISAESFLPRSNGVTNTVTRAMNHLRDLGHEVLVIAPGEGPAEVDGHRVFRTSAISLNSRATIDIAIVTSHQLRKVILGFSPDVIHLASPYQLGWQVSKIASQHNIPTVAVYQTDVTGFASFYGFNFVRTMAEKRLRRIHMQADVNLAPSASSISYLNSLGITHVKHWGRGVDHGNFNPGLRSKALRRSWGLRTGDIAIGYVGRLAPEKQVERLMVLNGIEEFFDKRVQLVVIGEGPSRQRLSHTLPRAIFTGHLSGRLLGEAMASLDLLVTTGENETFCQVIQEGMAASLPVIAPNVGGPMDLVEHGVTGLLYPPGDPSSLRKSVLTLVAEDRLAVSMGQQGMSRVAGRDWGGVCDELFAHYEQAIVHRAKEAVAS